MAGDGDRELQFGNCFWIVIKLAAEGFELICGEASFSGSGEAGDEGVERFLFPTEFEEFFDEDAVFESGLGEVIEVKVGGGKDGGPGRIPMKRV